MFVQTQVLGKVLSIRSNQANTMTALTIDTTRIDPATDKTYPGNCQVRIFGTLRDQIKNLAKDDNILVFGDDTAAVAWRNEGKVEAAVSTVARFINRIPKGDISGFCRIIVVGHAGQDADIRVTPMNGSTVSNVNLATNKVTTGADGRKYQSLSWFRINGWNRENYKLADIMASYIQKGNRVLADGYSLTAHGFETKDGRIGASLEVAVNTVVFLGQPMARDESAVGAEPQSQTSNMGDIPLDDAPAPKTPVAPRKTAATAAQAPHEVNIDDMPEFPEIEYGEEEHQC